MSDPIYEPKRWNHNRYIRLSHNCYSYALNTIDPELGTLCKRKMRRIFRKAKKDKACKNLFPQPGRFAGYKIDPKQPEFNCSNVEGGVLADNPDIIPIGNTECPQGYYKIALATNDIEDDYHFWRRDLNGTWSHKNGRGCVHRMDHSNNKIFNPVLADRGEYTKFCGFYCVPNFGTRHLSNVTKW